MVYLGVEWLMLFIFTCSVYCFYSCGMSLLIFNVDGIFSSLLAVSTANLSRGLRQMVVLVPLQPFTLLPSWSTWLLRFWSWLGMLARIWRLSVSPLATFSWPSVEMRSSTPSSRAPLQVEASSRTSTSPWSTSPPRSEWGARDDVHLSLNWTFVFPCVVSPGLSSSFSGAVWLKWSFCVLLSWCCFCYLNIVSVLSR